MDNVEVNVSGSTVPPHVGRFIDNIKQSKFTTNVALGQQ